MGNIPSSEAVGVGGTADLGHLRRHDFAVRQRPHGQEGRAVACWGAQRRGAFRGMQGAPFIIVSDRGGLATDLQSKPMAG